MAYCLVIHRLPWELAATVLSQAPMENISSFKHLARLSATNILGLVYCRILKDPEFQVPPTYGLWQSLAKQKLEYELC